MERKYMYIKADGLIEKATKLKEGEVDFVVSTPDLDSHGERIDITGVNYKSYVKGNNVILWAHDGFNLPIGNTTKMWIEGKKLMARAKFYLKDDFPRKIHQYIMDGVLKAVSIGGLVTKWSEDGITIKGMDMKEFSVVSVPANPNALVANKAFTPEVNNELSGLAKSYARHLVVKDDNQILRAIENQEQLLATLKELAGDLVIASETQEPQEAVKVKRRLVLRQAQQVDTSAEQIIRSVKVTLKKGK